MAKSRSLLGDNSGAVGEVIYYTRFGRTFVRRRNPTVNDRRSEAQLRQRALFKAMQHTSAIYGIALQRGLTRYAHSKGHTEANEFARLNARHFTFADGVAHVDYPALQLAVGPLHPVDFSNIHVDGLHVQLDFIPGLSTPLDEQPDPNARPDDVVHIYAVAPQAELCQLVASVERTVGHAAFALPDTSADPTVEQPVTYHLYAIVESASTAFIPTLSAAEKQSNHHHRNINRRVSRSLFITTVTA